MLSVKRLSKQEWFIVICGIIALLFMYTSIMIPSSSNSIEGNEEKHVFEEQYEQHEYLVLSEDENE
ncbi:hypothetical protein [Halalkalibacter sp. APA_J-10(15)]|uniref:hypothetical protein n=1 Tax=unclassified Halalkalibacter TaxID=2893063 RepID=UPI001FF13F92|nr:hypothetical protein [Halalkalibacter sp. APA_J-10(15)]MCK0470851.1 hypothetical protein [Halalkalibacter sp. APA_J-10(15)]